GATITPIDGSKITLTGAGAANLTIDAAQTTQLTPTTWRYYLVPKSGHTTADMFVAGEIDVAFPAAASGTSTWSVTLPNNGGTLPGAAGKGSFTVTTDSPASGTSTDAIALGPLSLQGATIGLAGTSFSNGKLNLTIAIGVNDATLAIGPGASTFSANLHGIV